MAKFLDLSAGIQSYDRFNAIFAVTLEGVQRRGVIQLWSLEGSSPSGKIPTEDTEINAIAFGRNDDAILSISSQGRPSSVTN